MLDKNVWKFGLAGVVAVVAVGSTIDALGNVTRATIPDLAANLLPFESQAPLTVMDRAVMDGARPSMAEVLPVVQRALADQPLNAPALRLLAFANTSEVKSIALAKLAERVTRRDLATQLFLIEDAVRRNNIGEALKHYDAALRGTPSSSEILFPILSTAINDPDIRGAMAQYLTSGTPWFQEFIGYAATMDKSAPAVADLLLQIDMKKAPEQIGVVGPLLLARLVEQKQFDRARRLFGKLPGADRSVIERAEWSKSSTDDRFGVMAWQAAVAPSLSANFNRRADTPELSVFVGSDGSGVALAKLLYLPPGPYALYQSNMVQQFGHTEIRWQLKCLSAEGEALAWKSPDLLSMGANVRTKGPNIAPSCYPQKLELVVLADSSERDLDLLVRDFRLSPVH